MNAAPSRKLEIAAYCAIIVLCGVACTALIKNFILKPSDLQPQPPSIAGTKVSLDYDWAKNNKTLLLVLSETCKFCDDSAPFYKRMVKQFSSGQQVQFLAVFPQPSESATKHLAALGVSIPEVRQVTPSSLGVTGTPTLILVDKNGEVIDSWVGKLSPIDESKVIARIGA